MKIKLICLAATATLTLAACGYRGDLERPDPLWGAPDQQAQTVDPNMVATTTEPDGSYRDPITGEMVWKKNETGGEIPARSTTEDIGGSALPPPNG